MNPWEQKRYNDAKNLFMNLPVEEVYAIFVGNAPTSPAKYAFWLGSRNVHKSPFPRKTLGYAWWKAGRERKQELESYHAQVSL